MEPRHRSPLPGFPFVVGVFLAELNGDRDVVGQGAPGDPLREIEGVGVGAVGRDLPGIGFYAEDSWKIFVGGERDRVPLDDKLESFLEHPRRTLIDKAYTIMDNANRASCVFLESLIDDLVILANASGEDQNSLIAWRDSVLPDALHLLRNETDWSLYRCAHLMGEKNAVYGSDQLKLTGSRGIAVRCVDKLCRMINIRNGVDPKKHNVEGYEDSVVDLLNYSVLAILLISCEL